jgi:DNA-binding MarR family transcriptional regulator
MPTPRRTPPTASSGPAAIDRIDLACHQAAAGRLASRDLVRWVQHFGVNENEFRLLWLLARDSAAGAAPADQAALAERLVVSTAQVSGVVERLSAAGLLEPAASAGDRRRHAWRISDSGRQLAASVVAVVAALGGATLEQTSSLAARARTRREAA